MVAPERRDVVVAATEEVAALPKQRVELAQTPAPLAVQVPETTTEDVVDMVTVNVRKAVTAEIADVQPTDADVRRQRHHSVAAATAHRERWPDCVTIDNAMDL